jgi:hypothetical protein
MKADVRSLGSCTGFHDVFNALKDPNCRLKTLNVARCSFTKHDIVCLGEVIYKNTSLDSLRIQGLSKMDHVFPLVVGIQENMTLQLLDLSSSHITMTDFPFQCFTQALSRSKALKSLSISGWTLKLEVNCCFSQHQGSFRFLKKKIIMKTQVGVVLVLNLHSQLYPRY